MNWIVQILPAPLVNAIGWTLMHSLWQGALISLFLGVLLVGMRRFTARTRYQVASGALLFMILLSAITFRTAYTAERHTVSIPATAANASMAVSNQASIEAQSPTGGPSETAAPALILFEQYFLTHFPAIVTLWSVGLLVFLLKFLGSFAYLQRLRHYRTSVPPEKHQAMLQRLIQQMGLKRPVQLIQSGMAKTPMVIGHLKPVILFPAAQLSGLSQSQVEAILAHELAHIMRHDYLINLIQHLAAALFFFHPGLHWINRQIRIEREHCCDDLALATASGRTALVKALITLQDAGTEMAPAFSGPPSPFVSRIKRLMQPQRHAGFTEGFSAALILTTALLVLGLGFAHADANPGNGLPRASHQTIQALVNNATQQTTASRVTMMHVPLSLKAEGQIELFGEAEAEHGSVPQLSSWLIEAATGEVVWHLLPRHLQKSGSKYQFKEKITLKSGRYDWYVPQLGITYAKSLDDNAPLAHLQQTDLPEVPEAPPAIPAADAPAKAIAVPEVPPAVPAQATSDAGVPKVQPIQVAIPEPPQPDSTRDIDARFRETGKPSRRIRATVINGHVEAFRINNIHFTNDDINRNWEYVIHALSEIEEHRYVYKKPNRPAPAPVEARTPAGRESP